MRLGPILVPSAIVVAVGSIVAAQSGWLDGSASEPGVLVRTISAPAASVTAPLKANPRVATEAEPTSVGRSVSKAPLDTPPSLAAGSRNSGGASLDSDGMAAAPGSAPPSPAAASLSPESPASDSATAIALQQARDEADKAKQDVLEVTRNAIATQRASEAEFERQTAELNAQIAQLRARSGPASVPPADADAVNAADAKVATATAELADARERETALRAKLASIQAGASARAPDPSAADKQAADKQAADTQAADAQAAEKIAAAERSAAEAQAAAKALGDKVAVLETEVASKTAEADIVEEARHALDDTRARAKALDERVGALQAQLAATKADAGKAAAATAMVVGAKASEAEGLQAALASAQAREQALAAQVATLQAAASDAHGRSQTAEASSTEQAAAMQDKVAAMQKDLDDTRARARDVAAKLAAALSERQAASAKSPTPQGMASQVVAPQAVASQAVASRAVATLQDDLAGARRGEDILRRENGVLQHELVEVKTSTRLLGEKLAALQVGMGEPVPRVSLRERNRASSNTSVHERLVRQLDALKREQTRQQERALHTAAAGRSRDNPRTPSVAYAAGPPSVAEAPAPDARATRAERRAARRHDRQAARERDTAARLQALAPGPDGSSARRGSARGGSDDAGATIAQAKTMIRSGNLDQARALLQRHGGYAATRALADSYNPLTNGEYGAIGVDTDTAKATYYYQQAARSQR